MSNSNGVVPVPETPGDDPVPSEGKPKQRAPRKRVLGEGEGDYCIYEVVGQDPKLPKGALLPMPKVPRFEDTQSALRWIKTESGDLLMGKQVMIFRACELLSLTVQTKPTVVISTKPKIAVVKPDSAERS